MHIAITAPSLYQPNVGSGQYLRGLLAAGTRCTTHWEDLADLRHALTTRGPIGGRVARW